MALERYPAAADSDSATAQTVELMCRYIRISAEDPVIQQAAAWLQQSFAQGSNAAALIAWAVFWFVKHHVTFCVDESPMFRLGEAGQQDLLISPDVLIRMDSPREDCDGFTMLCCALLKALGVPFVIVTIAASPEDPSRFSHVFPMALTPSPLALDASHGPGPGWMVPAEHTLRWQAWDENGQKIGLQRPGSDLHGWVPSSRGLGQDTTDTGGLDLSSLPLTDTGTGIPTDLSAAINPGISTPSISAPSLASSGSSFNWTSFLNNLTSNAASVAKTAEVASLYQQGYLAPQTQLTSLLPILLLGGLGLLAVAAIGGRH